MTAARTAVVKAMATIDVVIEVLDARLPAASTNPMIKALRLARQRPSLKVLNKADAADPTVTAAWMQSFDAEEGTKAVAVSSKRATDVAKLPKLAGTLAPHRGTAEKPLRILVMGIPNVGKSTLINALVRRRAAGVGDEPGVTKNQSRYSLGDHMVLIDTPGLMWPAIEYPSDGLALAASHAIGVNAYIDEEVATFLAEVLLARYPAALAARYGFATDTLDGPGVIEEVAKKRGFLMRGGALDLEKAALAFLNDYRSGALGRVSLETPQTRAAMIAATPPKPTAKTVTRL